ncbi:MAG: zinc metalloprotease [Deltaproteobacteria bacterium]|nr:zinc metalloprotease [Deltaproteobacteria bacterium]MBI3389995.1 zinc metalloprotease [Deltaproteobacteria bacterium]
MQVHQRLLETYASFRQKQIALEHMTTRRLVEGVTRGIVGPVTIPVVVHVVHNAASENISAAQIKSQIGVLNKDYRATNPDRTKVPAVWTALVADSNVQFVLASKDPQGKKTSGITRTKTNRTSFSDDDGVKSKSTGGAPPWPSDKYLNLWVCSLGGGLLGYAQFPGGPPKTDGVVILNTAFGTKGTAAAPFNLGRTATHEIGHWLNLRHIWGDTEDCTGSDFVADTPNAATPNFGKPKVPHISCHNDPNGDMFMNYMDYVDDDAMFMFTKGQVVRMEATLEGPRSSIVS